MVAQTVLLDEDFNNCTHTSDPCAWIDCIPWSISHGSPHIENMQLYMWHDIAALQGEGVFTSMIFERGKHYVIELDYIMPGDSMSIMIKAANDLENYSHPGTPPCGTAIPVVEEEIILEIRDSTSNMRHIEVCFSPQKNYEQIWFHPFDRWSSSQNISNVLIDNIIVKEVNLNLPEEATVCSQGSIKLNLQNVEWDDIVQWFEGDQEITSAHCASQPCSSITLFPTTSERYSVIVTSPNGCVRIDTIDITVEHCCESSIDSFAKTFWINRTRQPFFGTYASDVAVTSDGGMLVVMENLRQYHMLQEVALVRLNKTGDRQWVKMLYAEQFHQSQFSPHAALEITNDNGTKGFLIGGIERESLHDTIEPGHWILIKTDESGNIVWSKKSDFGNTLGFANGTSLQWQTSIKELYQTSNGDIIVAGRVLMYDRSTYLVIMRLDQNGTELNRKAYQLTGPYTNANFEISGLFQTNDLGFAITGYYDCPVGTTCETMAPFILRINDQFGKVYHKEYKSNNLSFYQNNRYVLQHSSLTSSGEIIFISKYIDNQSPKGLPHALVVLADEQTGNVLNTWELIQSEKYRITHVIEHEPGQYHFIADAETSADNVFGTVNSTTFDVLASKKTNFGMQMERILRTSDNRYVIFGWFQPVIKLTGELETGCDSEVEVEFVSVENIEAVNVPDQIVPIGSLTSAHVFSPPFEGCEYCKCGENTCDPFSSFCDGSYDQYLEFEFQELDDCRYSFTNTSDILPPLQSVEHVWRLTDIDKNITDYEDDPNAVFELESAKSNEVCLFVKVFDPITGTTCWAQKCSTITCTPNETCIDPNVPTLGFIANPIASSQDSCWWMFEDTTAAPSGGYSLIHRLWSFGDGTSQSGATTTTHAFKSGLLTTYQVCLTLVFSNGNDTCWSKYCLNISNCGSIIQEPEALSAQAPQMERSLRVYPNPVKSPERLNLEIKWPGQISKLQLAIIDLKGNVVQSGFVPVQSMTNTEIQHQLFIDQLAKGVYLLRISDGISEITVEFVKEQ